MNLQLKNNALLARSKEYFLPLKSIYYECKQTTERNNVDSLAELIGDNFHFPKPAFENIEHL